MLCENPIIPDGIFGEPVIRKHERPSLGFRQMVKGNRRNFVPAQQFSGGYSTVACDYVAASVHQDRHDEAERFYTAGNLGNLASRMYPRISCMRLQFRQTDRANL